MHNPKLLLVVEEEPVILLHMQCVLEDAGFEVLVAAVGDEAIGVLDDAGTSPVCLVTDIRLGLGMKGRDVARHAREKHPAIAVVYITGDSGADWAAYGVPKSLLVPKPFAGAQLVAAVTTLLNEQATAV